jgi:PPP family 3-phenylpropionic acid transporter
MYAHAAVLEALIARGHTGEGRAISVSLFSSMAEWMTVPLLGMEYSDYEWPRLGLTHPFIAPYGVYPTSDKVPVLISIQNDREFERLCHGVIDRPGLEKDPDYATGKARNARRDDTNAIVASSFAAQTFADLSVRLEAAQIAWARCEQREGPDDPSAAPPHQLQLDRRQGRLDPGAGRFLHWRARAAGRRAEPRPAQRADPQGVRCLMPNRQTGRLLQGMRLAAYGAAYFFAAGAFMSYWPVWLRDRGVTDTEIGTLFMSRQIITVIATLSVGWIVHRLGGPRGVIVALGIGAIVMMVAYQFSYSFLAIFVVTMIWGFLWSPPMPLYDGVLVTETKKHGLDYARVRMWSSVAFIFGTFLAGIAVDRYGPPWVLYVGMASIVLLAPLALLLPATPPAHVRDRARPRAVPRQGSAAAACLPPVSAGLRTLPGQPLRALQFRHLDLACCRHRRRYHQCAVGRERCHRDRAHAVRRLAPGQAGRLRPDRARPRRRPGALDGHGLHDRALALVLLQALHSCTFAACHLGAMAFLQRALPTHGAAIGQSLYYALGTGATQAVVYQFSGILYSEYGQRAFLAMTVVSALGLCALLLLARTWNGGQLVGHAEARA